MSGEVYSTSPHVAPGGVTRPVGCDDLERASVLEAQRFAEGWSDECEGVKRVEVCSE